MNETAKENKDHEKNLVDEVKRFFGEHPFIAWNILTVGAFFIHWSLALILFFVSIYFWNKRSQEVSEQKRQQKVKETNDYVEKIKESKAVPTISTTSIFLEKGEEAFLEEGTTLSETRAVRKHSGGMAGVGFRVTKGVYVGGGRRSGTSESQQEWREIDTGDITITNKRLIFRGNKENRTVPLKKVISVDVALDSIEIATESKSKSMVFSVQNGYIWGAVMNIIRRVDDPLNLGDLKLDIQFK